MNDLTAEATALLKDAFAQGIAENKRNLFQEWRMQRMTEVAKELQQAVTDLGWETVANLLDDTVEEE